MNKTSTLFKITGKTLNFKFVHLFLSITQYDTFANVSPADAEMSNYFALEQPSSKKSNQSTYSSLYFKSQNRCQIAILFTTSASASWPENLLLLQTDHLPLKLTRTRLSATKSMACFPSNVFSTMPSPTSSIYVYTYVSLLQSSQHELSVHTDVYSYLTKQLILTCSFCRLSEQMVDVYG